VIVARLPRSSSFERRIAYLFRHGHALADWSQQIVSEARWAAPEMDSTKAAQSRLKEAAGIRRGGRQCTRPVAHDVLSWDEDENPEPAEMERAARSYLAAIGLSEHQAVMVAHEHNGKRHIHIVANVVHPITGRAADRTNDHRRAQAWALAYEQDQGRVRCRHRMAPRMSPAFGLAVTGKRKSGQRLSRVDYERQRKRKVANAEARARHKAAKWEKLIMQQAATAVNAANSPEKQRAGLSPAPRP